jgi:hypothetical protein
MGRIERTREIARRRTRQAKLKKLRKAYAEAKTKDEKAAIQEIVKQTSPFATLED